MPLDNLLGQLQIDDAIASAEELYNRNFYLLAALLTGAVANRGFTNPTSITASLNDGDLYYIDGIGTAGTDWEGFEDQLVMYYEERWIPVPSDASIGPWYSFLNGVSGDNAWRYLDGAGATPITF